MKFCVLRNIYKTIVPLSIRQLRWDIQRDLRSILCDFGPESPIFDFDYEKYWLQRIEKNALALSYPELVDLCDNRIYPGESILDIGCGNGTLLSNLKQRKPIRELGIDISETAVRLARENGVQAIVFDVVMDDVRRLGSFDVVTAFEILEHIPHPERLLVNLREIAGRVFVSIPNTGYYVHRLRLLAGRFPRQWIIHPAEHLRFWTLRDFELMSRRLGFVVKEVVPIRGRTTLSRWNASLFAEDLFFVLQPLDT